METQGHDTEAETRGAKPDGPDVSDMLKLLSSHLVSSRPARLSSELQLLRQARCVRGRAAPEDVGKLDRMIGFLAFAISHNLPAKLARETQAILANIKDPAATQKKIDELLTDAIWCSVRCENDRCITIIANNAEACSGTTKLILLSNAEAMRASVPNE